MYTELTFENESICVHVIMEAFIQRMNEDLRTLLKLYLDKKLESKICDRVEEILKDNKLISNGAATDDGDKLRETGLFSAGEYGQYRLTLLENEFTDGVVRLVTLKRETSTHLENSKEINQDLEDDLYDCDQDRMVHAVCNWRRITMEGKPITVDFSVVIHDDEVSCAAKSKLDGTTVTTVMHTDMDAPHILVECIPGYSVSKKSIEVVDISKLDQDRKITLSADYSDEDIGNAVNRSVFDRPLKSFRAEKIPLCAADARVAEKWIAELRNHWWKNEFVTMERAKIDQEYWSERLIGKRDNTLVKINDELLKELKNTDAYWSVASMIDLMPEAEYRIPFFISSDSDFNAEICRNIFSGEQTTALKRIVIVDNYPAPDSEKVIRQWTGNRNVEIRFLVNRNRYDSSKGQKLENRHLSENAKLDFDERKKSEAHSRYIILVKTGGDMTVWNMDNSIGQFRWRNGRVETNTKMKFTPEPFLYDKELEKIVRELK